MPVDSVADPGIDRNLGAPPASQNPSDTGVSGRSSTSLVTAGKTDKTLQMQTLGTGGGRVMSGANNLPPRAPEPKPLSRSNQSEGLQLVLDHRAPREELAQTNNKGRVSPQGVASAATSMPISMLNSFAGTNNNLNKSVQNMAKAPFGGVASALKNVGSGLQSAGTELLTKSPLITSTVQQLANYTQPPLVYKQSQHKLNLLRTMQTVYLNKSAARLSSVLQLVGRI